MSIATKPTAEPLEAPPHGTRRAVFAIACGNLLESYDVLVYGNKDVHPENEHSAHLEDPEGRNPDERE